MPGIVGVVVGVVVVVLGRVVGVFEQVVGDCPCRLRRRARFRVRLRNPSAAVATPPSRYTSKWKLPCRTGHHERTSHAGTYVSATRQEPGPPSDPTCLPMLDVDSRPRVEMLIPTSRRIARAVLIFQLESVELHYARIENVLSDPQPLPRVLHILIDMYTTRVDNECAVACSATR
jgi:hypothetical protein